MPSSTCSSLTVTTSSTSASTIRPVRSPARGTAIPSAIVDPPMADDVWCTRSAIDG